MTKSRSKVTLASLDHRVDTLDHKVDALDHNVDVHVDRIDKRFDRLDEKIDDKFDEARRYARVLNEETKDEIRKVAESVDALNDKVGRFVDRTVTTRTTSSCSSSHTAGWTDV